MFCVLVTWGGVLVGVIFLVFYGGLVVCVFACDLFCLLFVWFDLASRFWFGGSDWRFVGLIGLAYVCYWFSDSYGLWLIVL